MAKKWMQKAFGAHPGALHKAIGVPQGKKIPTDRLGALQGKLRKKSASGTINKKQSKMLKRVNLAMRVKRGDLR